jgi:hypothetical protein
MNTLNTCACGKPGLGLVFTNGAGPAAECGPCGEKHYAALPFPCDEHPGEPCGPGKHLAKEG